MTSYKFDVWFENGDNRQYAFFADNRDDAWKQFNSLDLACVTDVYMSFSAPAIHKSTPKFNHCFVYQEQVYGTPYSYSLDMMDGVECVCQWPDNNMMNVRTARILSEMCLYWGILTGYSYEYQDYIPAGTYYIYALKHFYSLAVRIESIWGEYAARAIFNTCGFEF